jgi:predicted nuclease with TOPRIM domain
MSGIAKILVVLNLFLAIGFLGAASTFLGVQENYKVQLAEAEETLGVEIADLKAQKDKLGKDLNDQRSLSAEKQANNEGLTAQLQAQDEEFGRLREVHNQLLGQYERLSQTASDLQTTIDSLNADKNRLIEEKDAALGEKRTAVGEKNDAVTEQKRLDTEILGLQDQVAELEKRLVSTSKQLEDTDLVVALYKEKFGEIGETLIGVPIIKAVVAGVNNDLNIVLFSVGRDDLVKPGYEFTIYRNNEYVATVVVDKVEKDHCSGYSKKEIERLPISVGDKGTTRF